MWDFAHLHVPHTQLRWPLAGIPGLVGFVSDRMRQSDGDPLGHTEIFLLIFKLSM